MTVQEILDSVRIDIQDTNSDRYTDAKLIEKLNEIYADFCAYTEIRVMVLENYWNLFPSDTWFPLDFGIEDYLLGKQIWFDQEGTRTQIFPKNQRDLDYERDGWVFEVGRPRYVVKHTYSSARLVPMPSTVATISIRFSYIPDKLSSLAGSPNFQLVHHDALVEGVDALCFAEMRDYANMKYHWQLYVAGRQRAKAQISAKTPDRFLSQKPVDIFNYENWDPTLRGK